MTEFEHPHYKPDPETALQQEKDKQEFLEVGKKQIAEAKESEQKRWQEKSMEQLKPADLLRLDEEGNAYVKELLHSLALVQGRNRISPELFSNIFFLTARDIQQDFPDATLKDILVLGEEQIKARVKKHLPKELPQNPEDIKITEFVKEDIKSAAKLLRLNIERYAFENGNLLQEPSGFSSVLSAIKNKVAGRSKEFLEKEDLKKQLQEQITFLHYLEDDPEMLKDNLNHLILSIETDRKDPKQKIVRTLELPYALEYSSIYIPSLLDYMKEIRHPEQIAGRMIQDKVVKAFELISQGYGEKEFSHQDSVAQFNTGTATSPGGGNYFGLTKGLVEKVRVLKAIGDSDVKDEKI